MTYDYLKLYVELFLKGQKSQVTEERIPLGWSCVAWFWWCQSICKQQINDPIYKYRNADASLTIKEHKPHFKMIPVTSSLQVFSKLHRQNIAQNILHTVSYKWNR